MTYLLVLWSTLFPLATWAVCQAQIAELRTLITNLRSQGEDAFDPS